MTTISLAARSMGLPRSDVSVSTLPPRAWARATASGMVVLVPLWESRMVRSPCPPPISVSAK
jgi:hypothetical protein